MIWELRESVAVFPAEAVREPVHSLLWPWHWTGARTGLMHDPSARVSLSRHRDEEAGKVMVSARAWRTQNRFPGKSVQELRMSSLNSVIAQLRRGCMAVS